MNTKHFLGVAAVGIMATVGVLAMNNQAKPLNVESKSPTIVDCASSSARPCYERESDKKVTALEAKAGENSFAACMQNSSKSDRGNITLQTVISSDEKVIFCNEGKSSVALRKFTGLSNTNHANQFYLIGSQGNAGVELEDGFTVDYDYRSRQLTFNKPNVVGAKISYPWNPDTNWHHLVVVTRNSGVGMEMYLDNASIVSATNISNNETNSNENIGIGADLWSGQTPIGDFTGKTTGDYFGDYFNGKIDEVVFLNRPLTTTEISNLYNSGNGKEVCVTHGCANTASMYEISDGSVRALYHLEDLTDSSGNNFTLVNNNSSTFENGKFNNAGTMNNTNQFFTAPNALFPWDTNQWSISLWFKIK